MGFVSGSISICPFLFCVESDHPREHWALQSRRLYQLLIPAVKLHLSNCLKLWCRKAAVPTGTQSCQCELSSELGLYSLRNTSVGQVLQVNSCWPMGVSASVAAPLLLPHMLFMVAPFQSFFQGCFLGCKLNGQNIPFLSKLIINVS